MKNLAISAQNSYIILMLTELEKKVIASIQGDISITERPFLEIAENLGVPEETVLDTLRDLAERGIIRRFGATLRHQKSGSAKALVNTSQTTRA